MSFLAILELLNFDFSNFEQLSSLNFTKIESSESLKLPKMTFLYCLNWPKFDFTQNWSGGKIIKLQQSQASTSYFESFWSIVHLLYNELYLNSRGYSNFTFFERFESARHSIIPKCFALDILY